MTEKPIHALSGPAAAPPGAGSLSFAFDGTQIEVRKALQSVEAWLTACQVSELTIGRVAIALAEALNNIVEHAFGQRGPGRITLSLVVTKAGVEMEICDDGRAMPGGDLPPRRPQDLNVSRADLPEGGFGWDLIRDIAAGIDYRRAAGRNLLTLRVLAAPQGRAE